MTINKLSLARSTALAVRQATILWLQILRSYQIITRTQENVKFTPIEKRRQMKTKKRK